MGQVGLVRRRTVGLVGLSVAICSATGHAQRSPAASAAGPGEITMTATSANVSQPGAPVRITILRWSSDEERRPVVAALTPAPPAAPAAAPAATAAEGGDAARGERAGAARGGRGPAGRGRGGARGGRGAAALTPVAALTAALNNAPTLGYIWTNDVTGYAIKYAYRSALPDGSERIILATNRRLGAYVPAWTPTSQSVATDYEFTLFEIRLNARGLGEGKTSLAAKVIVDNDAKTVALDEYAATPLMLQNVARSR